MRRRLTKVMSVNAFGVTVRFACTSRPELMRARMLLEKEPGTCQWLRDQLLPGDVFFDIGANTGSYSILAAALGGGAITVVAFEPHLVNLAHLITNVRLNGMESVIIPLGIPLDDSEGLTEFTYVSFGAGSSGSQLRGAVTHPEIFSERKYACTVDQLIHRGWIPSPTLVKLDVDGREDAVLRGMQTTLTGQSRPRSVQVEIQSGDSRRILGLMQTFGYRRESSHLTSGGAKEVRRGKLLDSIPYNAVFAPIS